MIKIAYQNGHGNGSIVWRLGTGGDFTLKATDPALWFSHQHNAYMLDADTMILFDNSNLRCGNGTIVGCKSRGQVFKLDTQQHTATPTFSVDLESFWQALGSAQQLPNGDFSFAGGYAPPSRVIGSAQRHKGVRTGSVSGRIQGLPVGHAVIMSALPDKTGRAARIAALRRQQEAAGMRAVRG